MDCIFTKQLVLRRITEEDLELIARWSCSAAAYGAYLSPENDSPETCRAKWENHTYWNDHSKTYLVEFRESHHPLGTIRYWQKPEDHATAMIALKIAAPAQRGKGFGTETQRGLIHHLFTVRGCRTVEMVTDLDNVPQQRCLEKLGFDFVEVESYQDHGIARQGRLYRITRDEYHMQLQGYL